MNEVSISKVSYIKLQATKMTFELLNEQNLSSQSAMVQYCIPLKMEITKKNNFFQIVS